MGIMRRYSALTGKRVEAHYRTGDIQLSVLGTLVSDSGKSIFVEERFSQNGKQKTMRVEIPYEYIVRVLAAAENAESDPSQNSSQHFAPPKKTT
jgi:hypothetical protein